MKEQGTLTYHTNTNLFSQDAYMEKRILEE